MHTPRRSTLALATVLAAALGAGCKTRLWDLSDLGDADLAGGSDASAPLDAAAPDLSIADLSVLPDLTPPPDLTRPHYCNGIYVFEENGNFAFFDPVKLAFFDLGAVACNVPPGFSPFSMGVSKEGIAWVEYQPTNFSLPSQLYRLDLTTGYPGACSPSKFANPGGDFTQFGMGFATDGPGAPTETLYVAGDNAQGGSHTLGSLDLGSLTISPIGPLDGRAELTGNGAGELWAFFADVNPHAGRVDKNTGALNPYFRFPQLGDLTYSAFAFGAFGGDFYAFIADEANGQQASTTVYRIGANDGSITAVLSNTGRHVVGAGVSTCAPIGLDE